MPPVDIHLAQGNPADFRRKLGEIVYQTMLLSNTLSKRRMTFSP